jgi:hypothetical protein
VALAAAVVAACLEACAVSLVWLVAVFGESLKAPCERVLAMQ